MQAEARLSGSINREVLTPSQRTKLDPQDDRNFYEYPRLVKHVDASFLGQVTELYRQRVPPGGTVLDLMSSWVSHLPDDVSYARVIGHGLNAAELARNPRLSEFFVRNLNKEPSGWSLADQSVDAVLCCVSVQYLQQPEAVFAEIHRVLKPGGVCIVTFSNRLFYEKAIQAWRDTSGYARCLLVSSYFQCVDGFTQPEVLTEVKASSSRAAPAAPAWLQPLLKFFQRSSGDPFYAVVSYRNFKRE